MWLLMRSALCVPVLLRFVEDCVVQLQEAVEDVERLEEEAICLPDVLIQSVFQEPVILYDSAGQSRPSFYPETNCGWNKPSLLGSLHSLTYQV